MDEELLIQDAVAGDLNAFNRLVLAYQGFEGAITRSKTYHENEQRPQLEGGRCFL